MGANGSMDSDEVGDRVGDALKIGMELHFKIFNEDEHGVEIRIKMDTCEDVNCKVIDNED